MSHNVNSYYSLIAFENIFKKKLNHMLELISECEAYVSRELGLKCSIRMDNSHNLDIDLSGTFGNWVHVSVYGDNNDDGLKVSAVSSKGIASNKIISLFSFDPKFINLYRTYNNFKDEYLKRLDGLKTDSEFTVDLDLRDINNAKMRVRDGSSSEDMSFCYLKNLSTDEKRFVYLKDERSISEEDFGKLYLKLGVDISSFPDSFISEVRDYEVRSKTKLDEEKSEELEYFRKLQVDRIMTAYEYFKKAAELLNCAKSDMKFDRVKLDNINEILFKNSDDSLMCLEIEEFFRNNMVLRMIDLSEVDLSNVNIRGMDFSGTNIHINPQVIYNKDMTDVNCTGLKFSPWSDSFEGVILDGTIINDWEAMIDLGKVKSYNEKTKISNDVVPVTLKN